jgi:hypothetical protein
MRIAACSAMRPTTAIRTWARVSFIGYASLLVIARLDRAIQ